jgi:hypothetical protein
VVTKTKDKRDTRDPEQIGLAIKELKKTGMSICEAADYIDQTRPNTTSMTNGKHNGS